jgi:cobaltochelatase CobS
MLHKHNSRTLRKPCDKCGKDGEYYWYHDDTRPTPPCKDCGKSGAWVRMEKNPNGGDPTVHACFLGKVTDTRIAPSSKTTTTPEQIPVPAVQAAVETPKEPATVTTTQNTDDTALALAEMLARLANSGPQVDESTVRALVKEQFDSVVFPTRTVTLNAATSERKEIPGSTHFKLADVLMDLEAGEHVMMVGPAGTGKSTIAEQCATALGVEYRSISLGPTTPESRLVGYLDATGNYRGTDFREAFENGMLFLLDEVDNGHPGILTVLNSALANGRMAFPDGMVERHPDFKMVATANTYGTGPDRKYVGRNALDGAFLDRWVMEEIPIDEALEQSVCEATGVDRSEVVKVLQYVRGLRKAAQRHRMAVILSPRATVGMCRLLKVGRKWDDAVAARVRRGISDQDWVKLTA